MPGSERAPEQAQPAEETTPPAPPPQHGQPSPTAVWIAGEQLEYLRTQADAQGTTKTQVFLDAFEGAYEQLKAEGPSTKPRRILPERPRRRRGRVEGGTQASLYLTEAEREVIDGLAAELGLTRSALAARVIERAQDPAKA